MVFCFYPLSISLLFLHFFQYNLTPDNTISLIYFSYIFILAYYFHFIIIIYILSCLSTPPFLFSIFHGTLLLLTVFIVCTYIYIYIKLMFFPFTFQLFPPFLSPILIYTAPMFSLLQRYLIYSHSGDTRCHPTTPLPSVCS